MNTNNTQYKKYIGMMVPKCLIHSFIHFIYIEKK